MNVARINYLNVGLIGIALALAMIVPFELLLLSYAVLGPLHYLTEISWLHDRGYYLPRRYDWVPLWALAAAGAVFLPDVFMPRPLISDLPWIGKVLYTWRFDIAFLAFSTAFCMVVARSWLVRSAWMLLVLVILTALRSEPLFIRVFAAYLPSLIHVCVFTGLFLLHGALKGREFSGYLTLVAFLAAGVIAWVAPPLGALAATEWAQQAFTLSFKPLTEALLFDTGSAGRYELFVIDYFGNSKAVAAVRFLGFVYCYHYLNWFSKTSIIGWHKVPLSRYAYMAVVWAASVGLYALDYSLGLTWLFLLSFGHFVLELPLNHRSMQGIARELWDRVGWLRSADAPSPSH